MATKRNIWPFGTSVTTYRRRRVSSGSNAKYKGYRVWSDDDGWHTSLDPGSWFDTKKDVIRFIDSWEKGRSNPRLRQCAESGARAQSRRENPELVLVEILQSMPRYEPVEVAGAFFEGYRQNPPKGWFNRCVQAVKAKGGAYDPNAVCAAQERKLGKRNILPLTSLASLPGLNRFGQQVQKRITKRKNFGMGAMNPTKSRKRNPEAESADAFEKFHGFPSTESIEIDKDVHYHSKLWEIGLLEKLIVIATDGTEVDLTGFEGALLCGNEDSTQCYVEGGDQSIELDQFGIGQPYHDKEDLGEVKKVYYFTNKTHLGDQGGEATYHHKFGEEKTRRSYAFGLLKGKRVVRPRLAYDVRNKALEFIGGEYVIDPEGIRN